MPPGYAAYALCKDICTRSSRPAFWAYKYDYERKQYSKEPLDDWACDAADAFCEGAKMLQERVIEKPKKDEARYIAVGPTNTATLDDLWKQTPKASRRI